MKGNPHPVSSRSHPRVRKEGLARMKAIEDQVWEGKMYSLSFRQLASQVGCDVHTAWDAYQRVLAQHRQEMPATREMQLLEALSRNRHLRGRLATAIQGGEVDAIREGRNLDQQYAEWCDLLPNKRVEVSGPGGGPILVSAMTEDERLEAMKMAEAELHRRRLALEEERRAHALEVEGIVQEPKALPAKAPRRKAKATAGK